INLKVASPSVTVGSGEGPAIVAELTHPADEAGDEVHVVPPRKHPERFHQMEEWVGIANFVHEHPLHRFLVYRGDWLRGHEDRTVAALSTDSYVLQVPESLPEGVVHIPYSDHMHLFTPSQDTSLSVGLAPGGPVRTCQTHRDSSVGPVP